MQQYFRVSPPSVHQMVLTSARDSSKGNRAAAASNCSLIRTARATLIPGSTCH